MDGCFGCWPTRHVQDREMGYKTGGALADVDCHYCMQGPLNRGHLIKLPTDGTADSSDRRDAKFAPGSSHTEFQAELYIVV